MKKLLLIAMALGVGVTAIAQNRTSVTMHPVTGPNADKAIPIQKAKVVDAAPRAKFNSSVAASPKLMMAETVVGQTQYDLQSNYGASGNRLVNWNDGTLSLVYTVSDGTAGYPDRGTGYNYWDGTMWTLPVPSPRIDAIRSGFPQVTGVASGSGPEIVICHHPNVYQIIRPAKGTGAFTEADVPYPSATASTWPRAAAGGANGTSIHVLASTGAAGGGQNTVLNYWRSQDNGATWDIQETVIPPFDISNTLDPGVDGYEVVSRGNIVAIVSGGFANDLALAVSTDNGTTWTRTVLFDFPVAGPGGAGTPYDELMQVTDPDGDGIADTINTTDTGPALSIDANGVVHVVVGGMRVLDNDTVGASSYFPGTCGLYYWNSTMAAGTILNNLIADCEDVDGDGIITTLTDDPGLYQCSLTGMPGISLLDDPNGTDVFIAYSGFVENTNSGTATPQSYRDIYYLCSGDNGNSWSAPVNLTNDPFEEEVFTNVAKWVDGDNTFHILYHADSEPGTGVGPDADALTDNFVTYYDLPVSSVTCITGVEENASIATSIVVSPNPSSSEVNVGFMLNEKSNVVVSINNTLGQVVESVNSGSLNAGEYFVKFDVSKYSSGVYMVNINVDGKIYTEKLVVK